MEPSRVQALLSGRGYRFLTWPLSVSRIAFLKFQNGLVEKGKFIRNKQGRMSTDAHLRLDPYLCIRMHQYFSASAVFSTVPACRGIENKGTKKVCEEKPKLYDH